MKTWCGRERQDHRRSSRPTLPIRARIYFEQGVNDYCRECPIPDVLGQMNATLGDLRFRPSGGTHILILLAMADSSHISEAEKSKTGYHNKLVTLVGLHYLQEWSLLEAELRRLRSFSPLQSQLQKLVMEYNRIGVKSLYDLGYLAPQQ